MPLTNLATPPFAQMMTACDAAMRGDLDYFLRHPWIYGPKVFESAARHGQTHIVKHFLDSWVRVDAVGDSMHFACDGGHVATVTLLVENALRIEGGLNASSLSTHTLWTPLMHAAHRGHLGVVNYLIENVDCGIDAISGGLARRTALHWACLRGYPEIVWSLLKAGANTTIVDGSGNTSAMVAKAHSPPCFAILQVSVSSSIVHARVHLDDV